MIAEFKVKYYKHCINYIKKGKNIMVSDKEFEDFVAQSFDFARNNDKESLEIMINAGLNVNLTNNKGDTLLMLAAYNNSLDVAKMLLQKGAEVDKKNDKNHTPLAGVCFKGYYEMADLLLSYGASPNGIDSGVGLTPINCAIMFQRKEILDLLLKYSNKKLGFFQKLGMWILKLKKNKKTT